MKDNISTDECGKYKIKNNSTETLHLVIQQFTQTSNTKYEFNDVAVTELLAGAIYEHTIDTLSIQLFYFIENDTDKAFVINTCKIDLCILGYIDKLVCCKDCLDCDATCDKRQWLGQYIATDTLYTLLIDLLRNEFEGLGYVYNYTVDYRKLHTIAELMDKLESLCSCKNC